MSSTRLIKSIIHPLAKENIIPCSRHFCLCIEYLNFSTKKDVQYYKNCMIIQEENFLETIKSIES